MKGSFSSYSLMVYTIIVSLSSGSTSVYGQNEVKPKMNLYWIHAGLGRSSLGSLGASAGLGIQLNNLIFSLRGTANAEEFGIFSGGDEFFDLGLLVGIGTRKQKVHASFSVGIARVTGSRFMETTEGGFLGSDGKSVAIDPAIGFPLELQLFHKVYRSSGIGLNFYWNLNHEESFGGLTVNFMFGKLR